MSKTRPLTQAQREEAERKRICQNILDRLNEKRGRERKTNDEFAEDLGIGRVTWWRWNGGGILNTDFEKLITALHRAGMTLEVVVKSA